MGQINEPFTGGEEGEERKGRGIEDRRGGRRKTEQNRREGERKGIDDPRHATYRQTYEANVPNRVLTITHTGVRLPSNREVLPHQGLAII